MNQETKLQREREEAVLWKAYQAERSIENRNRLVVFHRPLVVHRANLFVSRRPVVAHLVEDLITDGVIQLIHAVPRFDPKQGNKFSTFFNRRLDGTFRDLLREKDPLTRKQRDQVNQRRDRLEQLCQDLQDRPTQEQVDQALGDDLRQVQDVAVRSLEDLLAENFRRIDSVEATPAVDPSPENVAELLLPLKARTAAAVYLYFVEGKTMKRISEEFHLSESMISQMISRALKQLKTTHATAAHAAEVMGL